MRKPSKYVMKQIADMGFKISHCEPEGRTRFKMLFDYDLASLMDESDDIDDEEEAVEILRDRLNQKKWCWGFSFKNKILTIRYPYKVNFDNNLFNHMKNVLSEDNIHLRDNFRVVGDEDEDDFVGIQKESGEWFRFKKQSFNEMEIRDLLDELRGLESFSKFNEAFDKIEKILNIYFRKNRMMELIKNA